MKILCIYSCKGQAVITRNPSTHEPCSEHRFIEENFASLKQDPRGQHRMVARDLSKA
jgi:hypothetical protein